MKILKERKDIIFRLFAIIGLGFCECYYIVNELFGCQYSFLLVALAIFTITSIAIATRILPQKLVISFYVLVALILGILFLFYREVIIEYLQQVYTVIINLSHLTGGSAVIIVFALAVIVLLYKYILVVKIRNYPISLIMSILIIVPVYLICKQENLLFFTIYITILLFVFLHWFSPKHSDNSKEQNQSSTVVIISLIAIIIALSSVFTSNIRTNPLKWIDDINLFKKEGQSTNYVIVIDGQSKLTELSASYTYNDTLMMIVNSPYIEHLRSKTFDTYKGDSWVKAFDEDMPYHHDIEVDFVQYKQMLDEYSIPYIIHDMTVVLNAQSQMIFAPPNSKINDLRLGNINKNYYDDFYFDEPMGEGTIYTIENIRVDYNSLEFVSLIKNSSSNNLEYIENYLDIPKDLPPKINELAHVLTDKYESNYEKAKVIEYFLSSQYTYTIEPPKKANHVDFIEYFLFDTKQGFCTHYASSMVMLLRSINIPCRYVTGYVLTPSVISIDAPDEVIEQLTYVEGVPQDFRVQKKQSHAWVEVWFDDYGWLTFEPTSSYSTYFVQDNEYRSDNIVLDNIKVPKDVKANKIKIPYNIIILSFCIFVFLIISCIMAKKIKTERQKTNEQKTAIVWEKIKKWYHKKYGILILNETAREFANKADKTNEMLYCALCIYERALFSNSDTSYDSLINIKKLYKAIKADYKKQKKILKKEERVN